jgi:succinoglycan biosynthesis protein ExoM
VIEASTHVVVCVATFKRPDGLKALLSSLQRCDVPVGAQFRVLVIDNDAAGSGEAVVRDFARSDLSVDYAVEPRRGIAAARNAAILRSAPQEEWLVFVDDDEQVDEDWLTHLLGTAASTGADVVTGPVLPLVPASAPTWVVTGGWFERRRMRTGTEVKWAATNNVLVKRSALFRLDKPCFDDNFGLTGGSDLELFSRLRDSGARMVWCDEAIVREDVPASRLSARWLVRRNLRLGNVTGRLLVARRGRLAAILYASWLLAQACTRTCSGLARGQRPGRQELQPGLVAPGVLLAAANLVVSEYEGPLVVPMSRLAPT